MPDIHTTPSHQRPGMVSKAARHLASLFTLRRISFTLAGTFAFAGVAAALHNPTPTAGSDTPHTNSAQSQSADQLQQHADTTGQPAAGSAPSDSSTSSTSTNTSFSSTTVNGQTTTRLQVNGQDVDLPSNGTSRQTMTNTDGSRTTVDSSTSTSSGGSVSNSSHSSFSLNVTTNGSTEENK